MGTAHHPSVFNVNLCSFVLIRVPLSSLSLATHHRFLHLASLMEWVLNLFSEYIENDFKKRLGTPKPTVDDLWDTFKVLFPTTTARLLVQEPVGNTVRFKALAFYHADEMGPLIEDPMRYIKKHFGGGKFKINFYCGMQFIATINFKPEGPEIWRDLPELLESHIPPN